MARDTPNGPTVTYRYMKENLNRAVNGEMGECLDMEAAHHIRCGQTHTTTGRRLRRLWRSGSRSLRVADRLLSRRARLVFKTRWCIRRRFRYSSRL